MGVTMLISGNDRTAPYRISQLASGRQRLLDFQWACRSDGICLAASLTESTTMKGGATAECMMASNRNDLDDWAAERKTGTTAKDRWSQFFPPASTEFAVLF